MSDLPTEIKKPALSAEAERILKEDLDYLTDMYVHTSEGKRYLGTKDRAYNIEWRVSEAEFVKNWLIQFALGNDTGINYFNINEWMKHTNKGQGLVEVYSTEPEEGEVSLFIIPPLMGVNMNNADYQLLRHAISAINHNLVDAQKTKFKDSNKPIAEELSKLLDDKRIPIPHHIPDWFYQKHGLVPLVERQCFFIRDIINADKPYPVEDLYKLREILYKKFNNEFISEEEKTFVDEMSRNNIEWGEVKENETGNVNTEEDTDGFDPLSC